MGQEQEEISFEKIKENIKDISPSSSSNSLEITQAYLLESEAKKLQIQLDGQAQFLNLQNSWARHIRWQIWAVLGFQLGFVLLVGFNAWGFTDNINKLPYMYIGIILQSLANIVALGVVVARFLFSR